MSVETDARFAEILTSPQFRGAVNLAWESNPEGYLQQQTTAEDIIYRVVSNHPNFDLQREIWELRRITAIETLNGTEIGDFANVLQPVGGTSIPDDSAADKLGLGEYGPVKTNAKIISTSEIYGEPIDFLREALSVIRIRTKDGPNSTGPENYATGLKYFADKFRVFPSHNLDRHKIVDLLETWSEGYRLATATEEPNVIELTNIYFSIRELHKGVFPSWMPKLLVRQGLVELPNFDKKVTRTLYGALAKLPKTQLPPETATLIDLSMRQNDGFVTTSDMRITLRAISNLNPCVESENAFNTFYKYRNNLEEPMDLTGLDETSGYVGIIVDEILESPELIKKAHDVAIACARQAISIFKRSEALEDLTSEDLAERRRIVDRIVRRTTHPKFQSIDD